MEGTVPKGLAVSTFREGMFLTFLNGLSIDYMQFLGSSQFKFKKKERPVSNRDGPFCQGRHFKTSQEII
jgi:hypothetical protein